MAWAFRRIGVATTVAFILSACSTGKVTVDERDNDDQPTAVCGNGACDRDESCSDCPADCGVCRKNCGDGNCGGDESCSDCPADCGVCPKNCGNGACDGDESCSNCAGDCGECPGPVCGNNTCDAGETCTLCPTDCESCPKLAIWSDWRTATGTSDNAVFDGGKWDGSAWDPGNEVISAAGLGFPAGMENVFVAPNIDATQNGGNVGMCDGWPMPAVGKAVAFRVYFRHDLNHPGSRGDFESPSHHDIQAGVGDIAYAWSWKWGLRENDDIYNFQLTALDDDVYMAVLPTEYPRGTVLVIEWSFERVTTSTWRARYRVAEADDYATVVGSDDTVTPTMTNFDIQDNNILCPGGTSAPATSILLGYSGPGGWDGLTGEDYWGGFAVAITAPGAWIGPYPVGPEAN